MKLTKGHKGTSNFDKVAHEWYVEPTWVVAALLEVEAFDGPVWDPACGGGNIPKTCKTYGLQAYGSDLVDRGYGQTGVDFLKVTKTNAKHIITNPPFTLAEAFIRHARSLVPGKIAVLQRLAFLESTSRDQLFADHPISRVWVSRKRVSMPPGGTDIPATGGTVPFAWYVWDPDHTGPTVLGRI